MKAYSLDLRARIVGAVDRDLPHAVVARTFAVSVATVRRYLARRAQTASLAPRAIPGRPARIGPAAYPALRAQVAAIPDASLAEHRERWEATTGQRVSESTFCRLFQRLRLPLKQRPNGRLNKTPRRGRRGRGRWARSTRAA
ncbi:MAG: IS630 transposase-related protein [Candidatus Dormibacteraceae bacterium]